MCRRKGAASVGAYRRRQKRGNYWRMASGRNTEMRLLEKEQFSMDGNTRGGCYQQVKKVKENNLKHVADID